MNPIKQTTLVILSLAVIYFAIPSAVHGQTGASRADTVVLHGEPSVRGAITQISSKGISVDAKRKAKNIPIHKIRYVAFGGEPSALRQAREGIMSGQYEVASRSLDKIDEGDINRDEVKQDIVFYRAVCAARLALANGKEIESAANQMLDFVKKNNKSYHFYEAAELLGNLKMAVGDPAQATKFYSVLAKASGSLKYHGQMLQADAVRQQRTGHGQARKLYESVAAGGEADPRQKKLATIGMAACDASLNQTDSGIQAMQQLIGQEDPQDEALFAAAYNALGDCYRNSNRPKDAVLSYLHVDLLFSNTGDSHAESLHHLAKLWDELGSPDRSRQARQKLQGSYAGSVWSH